MKAAQLSSWQQREETLRMRLVGALQDFGRAPCSSSSSSPVHLSSANSSTTTYDHLKMTDLVQAVVEAMSKLWQALSVQAARNIAVPPPIPPPFQQQSHGRPTFSG